MKTEDPFLKMAEGRMPLPTVMGAAPTVVGEGQPMRPDRSYTTLKWLSTLGGIFGLDHFYLRNPYSGLLKGLTFGGFLIWWLWDMFQLWTEKDRVLLYGMSAPFDIKLGFGQGTIAEGKTHYEQRSDSALWMVAALFSFFGADSALLGNWGQMLRKITEFALFALIAFPLVTNFISNGLSGILTFTGILRMLIGGLIGYVVIGEWLNVTVPTFSDPATMFAKGIRVSAKQDKILNMSRSLIENIWIFGEEIPAQIMKDIGYSSISGGEFRKAFEMKYRSPEDMEAEIAEEDAEEAAQKEKEKENPIRWHWLLSYLVHIFSPLILLGQLWYQAVLAILYTIFPELALAAAAKDASQKAMKGLAAGENPLEVAAEAAMDVGASRIPGMKGMPKGLTKGLESSLAHGKSSLGKLTSVMENAESAMGKVDELTAKASQIKQQVETAAAPFTKLIDHATQALPTTSRNEDPSAPHNANANLNPQAGGARHEGPTGQGMVLGASVFALAGGAAIKLAVDYLLPSQ